MIADCLAHSIFLDELSDKIQAEYKIYLRLFRGEFGELRWQRISAGAVRTWLRKRAAATGAAGAQALYRTLRVFCGEIRLATTTSITSALCQKTRTRWRICKSCLRAAFWFGPVAKRVLQSGQPAPP
jgi:hypothetical protein